MWVRVRVSQPHAAVRVPPSGVSQRGALLQPGLHPASLPRHQDHQDARQGLGPGLSAGHQKGEAMRFSGASQCLFQPISGKTKCWTHSIII